MASHKHQNIHNSEDLARLIKEAGLKITRGRVSVLEFLYKNNEPVSIDVIRKKIKNIDNVTIYRILNNFVEKGIVYQTNFRDGKAYFEYQEKHHHHLVCTNCGLKESLDICIDKDIYQNVIKKSKSFGFIKTHMLEFFGLCNKCAGSKK